jgi:cobalamin biosynthesis protein CbiG
MPSINNPLRRNWNQIAEDLSALQEVVDLYKKRFECAGRSEIAEKLEGCVLALIGAEGVAKALALKRSLRNKFSACYKVNSQRCIPATDQSSKDADPC